MINKLLISVIRFYQRCISPVKNKLSGNPFGSCRFSPTCSQYGIEALLKHNVVIAVSLIIWRVLRCNPFSKGGPDPVPDHPFADRSFTIWFIISTAAAVFICGIFLF